MGGSLRALVVLLSVVFGDFDVMGAILLPSKADSVLIVDPDAVLSDAIPLECFETVARRDQEIRQGTRVIQCEQAPPCGRSDVRKFPDGPSVEQPLGSLT